MERAMVLSACDSHMLTPVLLVGAALDAVIPCPKPRSERWVSAVFPADSEDAEARMCSAGYQVCLRLRLPAAYRIAAIGLKI